MYFFSTSVVTVVVFVVTELTSTSCCVFRDLKILCHDKVFLSFIADFECYVATYFSSIATYNMPWSCHKLNVCYNIENFVERTLS